jgi:4-amino-4-deoxy-L-arabinose transferase-like glycosyltransferase
MKPVVEPEGKTAARVALGSILLIALLQSAWNALRVPALTGYDEPGHLAYILTLVREARLPHPLEGWSTFHPPFYYAAASLLWRLAEPVSPYAVLISLRSLGVAAALICAAVAFLLVRRQGGEVTTATVATLLVVFLPVRQLATTMIGNEAMAAALVALALLFLVNLQRDPRRLGSALAAGALAGLALGTKYTAFALLPACAIPFLRADLGSRGRRAAGAVALAIAVIAGPVYARNLALTGTPVPMTRELEPMHSIEQGYALQPRQASDYLYVPWGVFRNPSIAGESFDGIGVPPIVLVKDRQKLVIPGAVLNRNMFRVPAMVYAGTWWDSIEVRVPPRLHAEGSRLGTVLTMLGVIPTLIVMGGFFVAAWRLWSRKLRSPEAPVTLFAGCALALFVLFTWRAPSLFAEKASYLLQIGVPTALFFAEGIAFLGPRVRAVALAMSLTAALACAVVFTDGAFFTSHTLHPLSANIWMRVSAFLPGEHIDEALTMMGRVPVVNSAR